MQSRIRIVALALGHALVAAAAGAEQAGDPVLAALVEEALARNPDLAALREQVGAARARPQQARALADPMLAVVYTNDGWATSLGQRDMTTLAFMASQELPFSGKRRLRGEIAASEAALVEQQLERGRLALVAAVERAYFGLVLARQLLELASEQEQLWRQIEGTARARYAVGQGAQPDVLRTQAELTRVEERRIAQQAEIRALEAELRRLLDRPPGASVATAARLELAPLAEGLDGVLARLEARSPELRSAELSRERGALGVELAGRLYKPDFSLQAGYMNRGGLDPMWLAGVGISLPFGRGRLASQKAEAEAGARASESAARSTRLQLRFRTEERLAQLEATEKIAKLYAAGIIPQGQLAVEASIANYQTGRVPFVTVLEALQTLYDDRATHLGLVASHARIRTSLEEASLEDTTGGGPAVAARGRPGAAGAGATRAGQGDMGGMR